jgi:4-methyl-5(b-hydroxyethyl)-thiazole monophosphate biosynthesis
MKVLALLADGFEETEFVVPFDLWQRGGCEVVTASIKSSTDVTGAHGLQVNADTILDMVDFDDFDGIFLPGGGLGVKNLAASASVEQAIQQFDAQGKWLFAICAAPLVLSKAGLLKDRRCTCFPGCEVDLVCKEFLTDRVVSDGNIITSRGAGTAEEFALATLASMTDAETADRIRKQVVAR